MHNMPCLYTVDQGKNTDRSDVHGFLFLCEFFDMSFSALNFKAHKNFVLVIKNTYYKWFIFCCFLLSCTSYVIGRMLR